MVPRSCSFPAPIAAAELSIQFNGGKNRAAAIEELLETLVAIGQARQPDLLAMSAGGTSLSGSEKRKAEARGVEVPGGFRELFDLYDEQAREFERRRFWDDDDLYEVGQGTWCASGGIRMFRGDV